MKKYFILLICLSIILSISLFTEIRHFRLEKLIYEEKYSKSILNQFSSSLNDQKPNNTDGYHVYFVHGYHGSNEEFSDLVEYLVEDHNLLERYTSIQYFDYFKKGINEGFSKQQIHLTFSISDFASNFYQQLIGTHHSSSQIDIVAHSLGGLITREMIRLYRINLEKAGIIVNRIITLGTPHTGINLNFISSIFLFLFGNKWNTPILKSISTGSPFLQTLNSNPNIYSEGIEWIIVAGITSHPLGNIIQFLCGEPTDGLIGVSSAIAEATSHLIDNSVLKTYELPLFKSNSLIFDDIDHKRLIDDPKHRKTYSSLNSWLTGYN